MRLNWKRGHRKIDIVINILQENY